MKSKIFVFLVVMISIQFSTISIYGQDSIRPILVKQLKLNGETSNQEVLMPLRVRFNYVSIKITALVQNGELTVELFDPKGDTYGSFSIAGLISTENKSENQFISGKIFTSNASGNLLRTIRNPMIGQWKAKVSTKNAVGVINFQFTSEVTVYKIE
jgi:hypothetical protein